MSSPTSPLPQTVKVVLDVERTLSWTESSIYRASCVQIEPKGDYANMVLMIWCALIPDDAAAFPTPEHLAVHLPPRKAAEVYLKLRPILPKEETPKNESGSKRTRGR